MFYLDQQLQQVLPKAQQNLPFFMAVAGQLVRVAKGRRTQEIILGQQTYFIKQHYGVGWCEIFKNLWQGKRAIIGARNEWQALQKLPQLGILVPDLVAYGQQGINPARRQSFVVMAAVTASISLEDFCRNWAFKPPRLALKIFLIRQVATIANIIHNNGINHRDLYICHFLLKTSHDGKMQLYLIDWHRAGIYKNLAQYWRIKDLAALYFSTKELGLKQRDYYRFAKIYQQEKLRTILQRHRDFWDKVIYKGNKIYAKQQRV